MSEENEVLETPAEVPAPEASTEPEVSEASV